jgi:uncharacterized protein YyaL (SSP411 family)
MIDREIMLNSLERMFLTSDNIGLIQHSNLDKPDLLHGYSIDDNARGLIVLSRYFPFFDDSGLHDVYFNYLKDAKRDDGFFHNFKDRHGEWVVENPETLGDCYGRTLWALAEFINSDFPEREKRDAKELFMNSLENINVLECPHTLAFSITALSKYSAVEVDQKILNMQKNLCSKLENCFHMHSDSEWEWPTDTLTYCNARIPNSLLLGGKSVGDEKLLNLGLSSLDFLVRESFNDGTFFAVGNRGWYKKNGIRAKYDEQTIEAGAMAEACRDAFNIFGDRKYLSYAQDSFQWFFGKNSGKHVMLDKNGGIFDAITEKGVNLNQGAESLLSFLMAASVFDKEILSRG